MIHLEKNFYINSNEGNKITNEKNIAYNHANCYNKTETMTILNYRKNDNNQSIKENN